MISLSLVLAMSVACHLTTADVKALKKIESQVQLTEKILENNPDMEQDPSVLLRYEKACFRAASRVAGKPVHGHQELKVIIAAQVGTVERITGFLKRSSRLVQTVLSSLLGFLVGIVQCLRQRTSGS